MDAARDTLARGACAARIVSAPAKIRLGGSAPRPIDRDSRSTSRRWP